MESGEQAVTAADMARTLGVSYAVVMRPAHQGAIPAFRVGSRWRMFSSEVIAHLRAKAPTASEDETPPIPRRPTSRAHGPDSPGVQNMIAVDEYLAKIDPRGRLTREETIKRLEIAGFI